MEKSEKISLVMQMQPRYLKYLTETGRINIVFGEIKLDMYQEVGGGFVAELNWIFRRYIEEIGFEFSTSKIMEIYLSSCARRRRKKLNFILDKYA